MRELIFTGIGMAGSAAAALLGGWDMALQTLVLFMGIDWVTGGILLPVIFKKVLNPPKVPWRAGRDGKD